MTPSNTQLSPSTARIMGKKSIEGRAFPGGSDGTKSACNAGDPGLIPGPERSPGDGNGNPLQYSCPGNPVERGAWRATVIINRVVKSLGEEEPRGKGREKKKKRTGCTGEAIGDAQHMFQTPIHSFSSWRHLVADLSPVERCPHAASQRKKKHSRPPSPTTHVTDKEGPNREVTLPKSHSFCS